MGGRTRRDGNARWRRRLDGLAADRLSDANWRALARGTRIGARGQVRARPSESRPPPRLRAADRGRAGGVARPDDMGRLARPIEPAGRSRAAPADARSGDAGGAQADGGGWSGGHRGSARRAARPPGHARLGTAAPGATAGCSSARRTRRAAAFPRRLRPGTGRARRAAASARRSAAARRGAGRSIRAGRPGRAQRRRAIAAEAVDWRGRRTRVFVVPAPGRRRDARARAVLLRARRHARDHRPHSRSPRAGQRRGRRGGRQPRLARADAIRVARSTISSTTSPRSSRCSTRATRRR